MNDVAGPAQPLVCLFCHRTDGGPFYWAWKETAIIEGRKLACRRCLLERGVELPPEKISSATAKIC